MSLFDQIPDHRQIASITVVLFILGAPHYAKGEDAVTPSEYGPSPAIPLPQKKLIPTLNIAKVKRWQGDAEPRAAQGLQVSAVARGLQHPRWLYVLPNGDILVAESEAPPKPDDAKGIRGKIQKIVQKHAGSGGEPSANRITLLREGHNGVATERHTFLQGLHSPIGMALIGNAFYVADSDALLEVPYKTGDTEITAVPTKITDLPAGAINHHWTKSLVASNDGTKLYETWVCGCQARPTGLRKPEAKIRCVPVAGSISHTASRSASAECYS